MNGIINTVHEAPIVVFDDSNTTNAVFGTVDYSTVKISMLQMLYTPYASASAFFEGLAALEQGNGSLTYGSSVEEVYANLVLDCTTSTDQQPYVAALNEIQTAIACGDRLQPGSVGLEGLRESYSEMRSFSNEWASTWLTVFEGPCS